MGSNLLEALTRPFHNFTDEDAAVDGKKVYIMRPCMIHGPGNKGNLNLLYGVVSKGIPWPLGAFENRRSFTSIGNLQEVIKGLLTKDAPSGIYHMGDDEALSTNELIEVICSALGKKAHIWRIPRGQMVDSAQMSSIRSFAGPSYALTACHRDYSILGTDIQVKLFDDHITVESPGILPGLVRPYNIREMHFSRNPKIALYMRSYKLVKEFGEGVDRMFREMAEAGLPAPEYRQNEFMVYATIRQAKDTAEQVAGNGDVNGDDKVNDSRNDSLSDSVNSTYQTIKANPGIQRKRIAELTGKSIPTIDRHIALLAKSNIIEHRDSDKTGGYYVKK